MKKVICFSMILAVLVFLLAGCFMMPVSEYEPPAPSVMRPSVMAFNTTPVMRGDVRSEVVLSASYSPARTEAIRFAQSGFPVEGIFVSIGDKVEEGDIISALILHDVQTQFDELIARRDFLQFEIALLSERRALVRSQAGNNSIVTPYCARISALLEELNFSDDLLVHLNNLDQTRFLRATMGGTIVNAMNFFDRMISNHNAIIATISADSFALFVAEDQDGVSRVMQPGNRFNMLIDGELHEMEVINPDNYDFFRAEGWEERNEIFLVFVGLPPEGLARNSSGTIELTLGVAQNVLYINSRSLFRHGDQTFVYIVEDGLRVIRHVEIGFEGGGFVEIISGLEEGDEVIQ